jgi:uncharacterized protein YndB with AHSA1/START domain
VKEEAMYDTGKLKVTLPNDREIAVNRVFNAPRRLVWDAHTKPELIKQWMLGPPGWTMPTCEVDLRVGGKYRYVWAHPDKSSFEIGGTFREVAAPERMVTAERFMEAEAMNTMTLTEASAKTTMALTLVFASKEARDGALKTGMTGGMEQSYQRLDEMLASDA